jgi:hypothetical protein
MRTAIIAITTNSSISVNPRRNLLMNTPEENTADGDTHPEVHRHI